MEGRVTPLSRNGKISAILQKTTTSAKSKKRSTIISVRTAAFSVLAGLLALVLLYPSQGSAAFRGGAGAAGPAKVNAPASVAPAPPAARTTSAPSVASSAGASIFQVATGVGISTYDCDTDQPKTTFNLGDEVCARATGVPATLFPWRVSWVSPSGLVVESGNALEDSSTEYDYLLPTTDISLLGSLVTKNRGMWRVNLTRVNGAIRASAFFTVVAPSRPVADVFVQKFSRSAGASVAAGGAIAFMVGVVNNGPNAAQTVHLTDSVPAGATLASFTQMSGPTCAPADSGDCTIASLGNGDRAEFQAVYTISGGATAGPVLTTASVSSATTELDGDNNTAEARFEIAAGGGDGACVLECPNDIVTSVNANVNGQPGAIVNFGAAEAFGSCGTVSASPASGSFFPVGTTSVSSTSGGGSCNFNVTVVEASGPTISCPANVSVDLTEGCSATVATGTPTASDGATVDGQRSDGQPLGEPFAIGTTSIAWTATDSLGRLASCTQTVTVNANAQGDATPPTITAPGNLTLSAGAAAADGTCGLAVGDGQLGTAEATDDGCSTAITRTGVPAGNFFPIGTTTVTWKATDAAGNIATAAQTITIIENTPPSIKAPADLSFTCPSEVPTADPALANGGDPNLPGGGPVADNCSVPTVTVSDSSSGDGSAASPLIITRTYTATDAAGNTAQSAQTITVIDDTAPTVTAPNDLTLQCASDIPTASPSQATASDNCAAPGVTVNDASNGGAGTTASPLVITRTYTATDAAGNSASDSQTITVIDDTAPTVALLGSNSMTHECHAVFNDPGVTTGDNCDQNVAVATSGGFNPDVPGTYTITYTATDDAGNTATAQRTVTVVDTTAPVPNAATLPDLSGQCSVTIAAAPTATDSCGGAVTGTTSDPTTYTAQGVYTVNWVYTDASGNTSTQTQKVTVKDTTAPVIAPLSNIVVNLPVNSIATSMPVSYGPFPATDNCGGPVTVTTDIASGSPFSVGTTPVTVTAADAVGNSTSATFTVTVLYNFTGFFSPVGNLPVLNTVNAGRAIPLKFSLSGNKGMGIFAAGSPASQQIVCDSSAPVSELEGTETSGGSTLTYDAGSDQYHYSWKTEKSWAGTCRQLVVKLNDGSTHTALFKFK